MKTDHKVRSPVAHHLWRFNKPKIELDKRSEMLEDTHEDELQKEINGFEEEE